AGSRFGRSHRGLSPDAGGHGEGQLGLVALLRRKGVDTARGVRRRVEPAVAIADETALDPERAVQRRTSWRPAPTRGARPLSFVPTGWIVSSWNQRSRANDYRSRSSTRRTPRSPRSAR